MISFPEERNIEKPIQKLVLHVTALVFLRNHEIGR